MLRCLIPGQVAATHELSDERVVFGYGVHVAAAHEVGPRITDVRHLGHGLPLLPTEPYGDHGGAHPRELLVAAAGGHYPSVASPMAALKGSSGWRSLSTSTARELATSPASKPPMPSATTKSFSSSPSPTSRASSLFWRTLPACVRPNGCNSRKGTVLLLVPEGGRADRDGVPVPQGRGAHGLASVHESPVRRAEVLDVEQTPVPGELSVASRGVVVAPQDDGAARRAPHAGIPVPELEPRLGG